MSRIFIKLQIFLFYNIRRIFELFIGYNGFIAHIQYFYEYIIDKVADFSSNMFKYIFRNNDAQEGFHMILI